MGVTNIGISIINTYARLYPEYEIFILMNGALHPEVQSRLIMTDNIKIVNRPLPVFSNIGFLWSILRCNKLLKEIKPDVFIAPNFFVVTWLFPKNIKLVLYVHDLVYKEYRGTMQLITRTQMDLFFESSLKRADIIWFNSAYTRAAFESHYPTIAKKKALFTGAGINPGFLKKATSEDARQLPNPFYKKTDIRQPYILFVGTVEPRKNLSYLLRLFSAMEKDSYRLVIVGDPGWGDMRKKIDDILTEKDYPTDAVHFMGYVTDDELIALYRDAAVFISTSLNEGLGLPQLEAMACGCPVVCPHNSAMIEVVEGAGITVKEWFRQDWIDAISEITVNRAIYVDAGHRRVQSYHWDNIVSDLHEHLNPCN
jgi:glycosyltransferase involved in cell wall biosynthesis